MAAEPKKVWDRHDDGTTFSVEMSTLQGNGLFHYGVGEDQITGPGGKTIGFREHFKQVTNDEGEITHWEYKEFGFIFIVWND